ncbi:MAG: GldG family protein [Polyangia bacterium]
MKRGRQIGMGGNTAVSVIGAAAILVMANYLVSRHYVRGDWTGGGIYTLSDKSEEVVGGLEKNISLYMMWSQADLRFADVKELLDNYAALSPHLSLEVVDPDLAPEKVQMLTQRYGGKVLTDGVNVGWQAGVFVVSGENVKFVGAEKFEAQPADPMGRASGDEEAVSGYRAEQEITSALLRVTAEEQAGVCFVQGHGERELEGFGRRSLARVKDELEQDSYRVEGLITAGTERVPAHCDLVVVAGPQRAFTEKEAELLGEYVDEGGRLLLLLDPLFEGDRFAPTGLERLCADRGIVLHNDLVVEVEASRLVSMSNDLFTASEFTSHEAVEQLSVPVSAGADASQQLGAYPVVFASARSLEADEESETVAEPLARSSESSWGETDLSFVDPRGAPPEKDQYDVPGPAVLAMAAALPARSEDEEGGRLVVVGDSDVIGEELIAHAGFYNRDFWSGLVGWLTSREDLISIAPKDTEHIKLTLSWDDFLTIVALLIGEVLLGIAAGVVVWIRRRS